MLKFTNKIEWIIGMKAHWSGLLVWPRQVKCLSLPLCSRGIIKMHFSHTTSSPDGYYCPKLPMFLSKNKTLINKLYVLFLQDSLSFLNFKWYNLGLRFVLVLPRGRLVVVGATH